MAETGQRSVAFAKGLDGQAVILTTFLWDELGIDRVGAADLDAVWNAMMWKCPEDTAATLDDVTKRTGHLSAVLSDRRRQLTQAGEVFGRYGSLNPA